MKRLWPRAPIHLYFRAPLLYGMLRAVTAACSVSGCYEACGGGWSARLLRGEGGRAAGKVFVRRGGCRTLRMETEREGVSGRGIVENCYISWIWDVVGQKGIRHEATKQESRSRTCAEESKGPSAIDNKTEWRLQSLYRNAAQRDDV